MLVLMTEADEPSVDPPGFQAGCWLCGRPTFDPAKGDPPWARASAGGRQVLICPTCQRERPEWTASVDRCEGCGSTRLSVTLGEVVCRACGHVQADQEEITSTGA
jgi:hypothetical protein